MRSSQRRGSENRRFDIGPIDSWPILVLTSVDQLESSSWAYVEALAPSVGYAAVKHHSCN